MHIIEGKLERDLRQVILDKAPHEAVGLILPDGEVIELTNHDSTPENRFKVSREELASIIADDVDILQVTFWHSHPQGGIGPSRTDMKQKTPFTYHLVVALVDGDMIPTWY